MDGQAGGGQRVRPVPMEKKIYGVPVFPASVPAGGGYPAGGGHSPGASAVGGTALKSPGAPPERNGRPLSLFDSLAEAEGRRGAQPTAPLQAVAAPAAPPAPPAPPPQRWKLRHMDFAPNLVKSKKDEDYERFQTLVERANQWSVSNPQCEVLSAETVTWTSTDRPLYTDAGVLQRSMSSDRKTRVLRGLRVWYQILDETFYDLKITPGPGPYKLGYINYTLDGKADTILSLLAKVNSDMFKRTVAGKILKVETLTLLSDVTDADVNAWSEQPDKSRDYVCFLRLFYVFKKDGAEDCSYGDIGIRDFQPVCDARTPHNQGYEVFADLWSKAARWVYTNPQLRLINAQGVYVKLKKESEAGSGSTTLWDRCNHREHGSAYGSLTHQKTEYYQILRIVYHQPPSAPGGSSSTATGGSALASGGGAGGGGGGAERRKFYYKTFSPSVLKRAGGGGVGGEDSDPTPPEGLYEDLRQMEDKTNAWLVHSDARVASVETVPTRLLTGGQETLGSEATFVYNDRERNQSRESWRVNIRLYLDGEYKDPPPAWRNSIVEKSIALTSGGGGGASGGGGGVSGGGGGANHTTEL